MDLGQRAVVLRCLEAQCGDGQLLVDLFVNYDCDLEGANLFERTVGAPVCSAFCCFHVSESASVWSLGTSVHCTSLQWRQATTRRNAVRLRPSEAAIWDAIFPCRWALWYGLPRRPSPQTRPCKYRTTSVLCVSWCATHPVQQLPLRKQLFSGLGAPPKILGRFRPQNHRPHQTCWIARRSGAV